MAVFAALSGYAVYWLWDFFVASLRGQQLDQAAFNGAALVEGNYRGILGLLSTEVIGVIMAVAILIAIFRQQLMAILQVVVIMAGANITTQLLKKWVLDRPDLGASESWYSNSLPSGHTTAMASACVAIILVLPAAARPLATVFGTIGTVMVGVGTLAEQWHRPSDVIAALFVVFFWLALAAAFTDFSRQQAPNYAAGKRWTALTKIVVSIMAFAGVLILSYAFLKVAPLRTVAFFSESNQIVAYQAGAQFVTAVSLIGFAVILLIVNYRPLVHKNEKSF